MIARIRAWLDQSGPTPAAPVDDPAARIAELEKLLSTEQMHCAGLTSDAARMRGQIAALRFKLATAEAEAERLAADHTYVTAERCECGGDAELHWRTRAHELERQAAKDRANAVLLTERVAGMQERVDEADRIVHLVEQLHHSGAVSA